MRSTVPLLALITLLPFQAHGQLSPVDSAEFLTQAALRAFQQGSSESLRQSIRLFQQALPQQRSANDRQGESITFSNIGLAYKHLGHADSALNYYARALPILHQGEARGVEGTALSNIGSLLQDLGHPDTALVFYVQALSLQNEVGDRSAKGTTLNNIGTAHQALGHADSALLYYAQALAIRRQVGDRQGEGETLANIGTVHDDLGRADSALAYFTLALPVLQGAGDLRGEAATLEHIGGVHHTMARTDSALSYFFRALAVHRRAGNRRGEGTTLNGIGVVHQSLGLADSALYYYERALAIRREVWDRRGEAITLANIGAIIQTLGSPDSALVYYARALAIYREGGNRRNDGTILINIGSAHEDLGHPDSALVYYGMALPILRQVGNRRAEATALNNIGLLHSTLGRADSALVYYSQALPILRETRERRVEFVTLGNTGLLFHRDPTVRNLERAVSYYDSTAAVIAEIARSTSDDPKRLSVGEQGVGLFQEWTLAWLARASDVGKERAVSSALAVSERGRAQALRELMSRNPNELSEAATAGLTRTSPGGELFREGQTLTSAVAHSRTSVVSYVVTPDTLLAFLLVPGHELEVFRTVVPQNTLDALVAMFRAGLCVDPADLPIEATHPDCRIAANNIDAWKYPGVLLSVLLFPAELRAHLPVSGELLIVPAGALSLLPFAALPLTRDAAQEPDSLSFLGLRYAIRYVPSLQVLADLEARPGHSRPTTEALVVGNPTMPRMPDEDGGYFVPSRLSGAEVEARWVAGFVGAAVLTGNEATEAAVQTRLGRATLVHLATHGFAYASSAHARDSFVALAPGAGEDGLFTVGELLDEVPELRAELVVLSACQTGLGNLRQAEGTVGLQRAFLARGARGVLVSLWSVSDEATTLLMQRFYTHWLGGDTRAEALRRAQVELAADPRFAHPRYWAAYEIAGAH